MIKVSQLPSGIARVDPRTNRRLRVGDESTVKSWVWLIRATAGCRGNQQFKEKTFRQDIRSTEKQSLAFLQAERELLLRGLKTDIEKPKTLDCTLREAVFDLYLPKVKGVKDRNQREHALAEFCEARLEDRTKLGDRKLTKVTPDDCEYVLDAWTAETRFHKGKGEVIYRFSGSTLRSRAFYLSNVFTRLTGKRGATAYNPVMDMAKLPPKGPEVSKAEPMDVVREVLRNMKHPAEKAHRTYPTFGSCRIEVMGLTPLTLPEMWTLDKKMIDLRRRVISLPDYRIEVKISKIAPGIWDQGKSLKVPAEPKDIPLSEDAAAAWKQYLSWDYSRTGTPLIKFGVFTPNNMRSDLRRAGRSLDLEYDLSPVDFGTCAGPSVEVVKRVVEALRATEWDYQKAFKRNHKALRDAYVRACCLAFTGMRVGELAILVPADIRLGEQVIYSPTEKKKEKGGREIFKRRIPLNAESIAAFKMFIALDLFGGIIGPVPADQVPDQKQISWYWEIYNAVRQAARRIKDPYTGAALKFHPHVFRHSFATELVNGPNHADLETCRQILGQADIKTTKRYVRANEAAAKIAIEAMSEGVRDMPNLADVGFPLPAPETKPTPTAATGLLLVASR